MTDVQQPESSRSKPKRVRKQAQQLAPVVPYDDKAVAKGKKLAATLKSGDKAEWELGKLADQLELKGETLASFAEEIGLKADRLNRCRSVYRAWKDKDKKGVPPKFAVLQALQAHPLRDEIIKENPDLTQRQARTFMRDYNLAQGQAQADENWKVNETRRWYAAAVKHAQEAIKYGHPEHAFLDPDLLRKALDNPDQTIASLRLGGEAFISAANTVERALAPPPAPMFDDPPAAPGDQGT
jgi:hypothetical protein